MAERILNNPPYKPIDLFISVRQDDGKIGEIKSNVLKDHRLLIGDEVTVYGSPLSGGEIILGTEATVLKYVGHQVEVEFTGNKMVRTFHSLQLIRKTRTKAAYREYQRQYRKNLEPAVKKYYAERNKEAYHRKKAELALIADPELQREAALKAELHRINQQIELYSQAKAIRAKEATKKLEEQ